MGAPRATNKGVIRLRMSSISHRVTKRRVSKSATNRVVNPPLIGGATRVTVRTTRQGDVYRVISSAA